MYKMRQKRDVTLIVLSVIFLFVIAGCDDGTDDGGGAPTTPFLGGSKGLVIGFLEGNPPEEVTDGGTFPFQAIISLKNVGEYDLKKEQVEVDLIGILPSDFGVSDPAKLKNKNPEDDPSPRQRDSEGNIIESIETIVTFPESDEEFNFEGGVPGNNIFVFRADVCYNYQTQATSDICVLENMIDVADDAICDPSEEKAVFSSGSPIQVNSFRQTVVGRDRIQFSFDIVHSGAGDVFVVTDFSDDVDDECPKTPTGRRINEDKLTVTIDTGLDTALTCAGLPNAVGSSVSKKVGLVKLVNGKRTITCTQTLGTPRNDFTKKINIDITFNYLDKVDQEILVKHLLGAAPDVGWCGDGTCDPGEEDTCTEDCL